MSQPPGRIPFEELSNTKSWLIPEVNGRVINGDEQSKRKAQLSKRKAEQQKRTQPEEPVVTEEVVEPEQKTVAMITAGELEEITQAAEQDGYEKGYKEGVEQGKQDGRKAGYSDGLKAGTDQANSEHGQWLKEQGENLHALCSSLIAPLTQQQTELADATLDLALGLAQHILDAELSLDPQKIVPVVDKAIAALPPVETGLKLYLHPDDLDAYKSYGPEKNVGAAITHDAIHADDSLARGSCRVHSEHSFVDYSVADRLQEFADDIAQKKYESKAAEEPVAEFVREDLPKKLTLDEQLSEQPSEQQPEQEPERELRQERLMKNSEDKFQQDNNLDDSHAERDHD